MGAPLGQSEYVEIAIAIGALAKRGDSFSTTTTYGPVLGKKTEISAYHTLPFQLADTDGTLPSIARVLRTSRMAQRFDSAADVQLVGAALFETLFTGGLERLYASFMERGENTKASARIRLSFDLSELGDRGADAGHTLAALPWECAYDARRKDFVALMPRISIVRSTAAGPSAEASNAPTAPPSPKARPLRAIKKPRALLIASDDAAGTMGSVAECKALDALLEVTRLLENPSPEEVLAAVEQTPADIIHFAGHVVPSDPLRIPLSVQTSSPAPGSEVAWLSADALADRLQKSGSVQLVYLSACDSALLAGRLVSATPAAIGVHGLIRVDLATPFAKRFYEVLLGGAALDVAMADARDTVDRAYPGEDDWALPVLWTNDEDCLLVERERGSTRPFPLGAVPHADSKVGVQIRLTRVRREIAQTNLTALRRIADKGSPHPSLKAQMDEEARKLGEADKQLAVLELPQAAPPPPEEK